MPRFLNPELSFLKWLDNRDWQYGMPYNPNYLDDYHTVYPIGLEPQPYDFEFEEAQGGKNWLDYLLDLLVPPASALPKWRPQHRKGPAQGAFGRLKRRSAKAGEEALKDAEKTIETAVKKQEKELSEKELQELRKSAEIYREIQEALRPVIARGTSSSRIPSSDKMLPNGIAAFLRATEQQKDIPPLSPLEERAKQFFDSLLQKDKPNALVAMEVRVNPKLSTKGQGWPSEIGYLTGKSLRTKGGGTEFLEIFFPYSDEAIELKRRMLKDKLEPNDLGITTFIRADAFKPTGKRLPIGY